jgi:hypothetical protein
MNPSVLTVYESPYPKLRLGKDNDGGYILADIPNINYSILLAGGISRDISFEEDFVKKYNIKCIAFDGTINQLPKLNDKIEFVKKNIGSNNTDKLTNLTDIINKHENIFIKMDIEGGEIAWIKCLNDTQMNKFNQIVMEFHNPFTNWEKDAFDKLNKNHILIHFHGNNCCGTRIYNDIKIPKVFECTYLHKKFFKGPLRLNTDLIPGKVDMKNVLKHEEIYIDYPPFVHKLSDISSITQE